MRVAFKCGDRMKPRRYNHAAELLRLRDKTGGSVTIENYVFEESLMCGGTPSHQSLPSKHHHK
jgi:hypothetical protein